jgi:hypothetical protein
MLKPILAAMPLIFAGAGLASADTICGIPFASAPQIEAQVLKFKKVVKVKLNDYVHGYTNPQTSVAWIFTTPKSAAHPAVVCRWLSAKDGKSVMLTDIRCAGKKDACDKLALEYKKRDKQFDALVDAAHKKPPKPKKK